MPRSERLTLNELSAFQIGDYVVHESHGVGIYKGIEKIDTQTGIKIETIVIHLDLTVKKSY